MSEMTDATPAVRHALTTANFNRIVELVTNWDAPTPVKEWVASDVVDHLTGWLPGFLASQAGVTLDEATESADYAEKMRTQTESVQRLLESEDAERVVTTEWFGTMKLADIVDRFYTTDVFMHSYDLAASQGIDPQMDEEMAQAMYERMAQMPGLRESGQFGEQQPEPADASGVDKLIAFIGRDPRWTPAQ